jgi:RNA polymerase sigma factor (sigma-70 family)
MAEPGMQLTETAEHSWDDARLVRECLDGNERAWSELVDKYKRLIFSIPFRYGASRDDAADIFQAVCLEMFSQLGNLRKVESLRSWLITVTVHKSFHWKKQQRPQDVEIDAMEQEQVEEVAAAAPEMLEEVEREQVVRDAIRGLKPRCAEMIRLLFYEDPPLPYTEVAQRLGLATGSIGFIRGRCLKHLGLALRKLGF